MSLLTISQDVAREVSIPVPTAIADSNDEFPQLLFRLANKEIKSLFTRHAWRVATKEKTITATGNESQGDIITGSDGIGVRGKIVPGTIWNLTSSLPIETEGSSIYWHTYKNRVAGPCYSKCRFLGNELNIVPAPTAGDQIKFEYVEPKLTVAGSGSVTFAASGTVTQEVFSHDNDTCLVDEEIVTLGVIWRWLRNKKRAYAQEFEDYEKYLQAAISRDRPRPILNFSGPPNITPGVWMDGYYITP